jgi:ketosteroid isomerase-like protein
MGIHTAAIVLAVLLGGPADRTSAQAATDSIEEAVLAVSDEMTRAGESLDADRLFSFIRDNDKGAIIENGVLFTTKQEALERVKANLAGASSVRYRWKRRFVTVLAPDLALLTAEGESTATAGDGRTFTVPFAQTVVFSRKADGWKAVHAHQSAQRPAR